jgi:AcrR family transcriptional regulator
MPRLPDAALEEKIIAAAMRLLDRGGDDAVTLRAVAKEAGTTTPTLYERFPDRDALMRRVIDRATEAMVEVLRPCKSVRSMFRAYLRDALAHSNRVALSVRTFGERYVRGDEMPGFDLLKARLTEELGVKGSTLEDLALAIASLAFGTAQGMIAAGSDTKHAMQFQRSALRALKMLLKAFGEHPPALSPISTRRKPARKRKVNAR